MKINQPKQAGVGNILKESDKIQEKLYRESYVHHDHGGREHGHDWDDWIRAGRIMEAPKKKPR